MRRTVIGLLIAFFTTISTFSVAETEYEKAKADAKAIDKSWRRYSTEDFFEHLASDYKCNDIKGFEIFTCFDARDYSLYRRQKLDEPLSVRNYFFSSSDFMSGLFKAAEEKCEGDIYFSDWREQSRDSIKQQIDKIVRKESDGKDLQLLINSCASSLENNFEPWFAKIWEPAIPQQWLEFHGSQLPGFNNVKPEDRFILEDAKTNRNASDDDIKMLPLSSSFILSLASPDIALGSKLAKLKDKGFQCAEFGKANYLNDSSLPRKFEGTKAFFYGEKTGDAYCWLNAKDIWEIETAGLLKPNALKSDTFNIYFSNNEGFNQIAISCEIGNFCANSNSEQLGKIKAHFGVNPSVEVAKLSLLSFGIGSGENFASSVGDSLTLVSSYDFEKKITITSKPFAEVTERNSKLMKSQLEQRQKNSKPVAVSAFCTGAVHYDGMSTYVGWMDDMVANIAQTQTFIDLVKQAGCVFGGGNINFNKNNSTVIARGKNYIGIEMIGANIFGITTIDAWDNPK